jgi:hypothetical protein
MVISGNPRAIQTGSDLRMGRLTRCVKRPSKQQVTADLMHRTVLLSNHERRVESS